MRRSLVIAFTAIAAFTLMAAECESTKTEAERADKINKKAQDDVKARATAAVPVPPISNFQARRNLKRFMERVDERGKIWYVYERARQSGEIIGVYYSSSYPQSVCTFMTPPEEIKIHDRFSKDFISTTTAMALDGVYYKGGDCPDFFFDYTTNAMVVLDADAVTIAVDKPLDVKAPKLTFSKEVKDDRGTDNRKDTD